MRVERGQCVSLFATQTDPQSQLGKIDVPFVELANLSLICSAAGGSISESFRASIYYRHIRAQTLEQANQVLMSHLFEDNAISMDWLRIDSTVTDNNIAAPSVSQLLTDGVSVLSLSD